MKLRIYTNIITYYYVILFKYYSGVINRLTNISSDKINCKFNISSTLLVVTGTLAGGVTLNPVILGTISGLVYCLNHLANSKIIEIKSKCVNLVTQHMKNCKWIYGLR